jgi:DNA replication ATP-dependent helicase Dna2
MYAGKTSTIVHTIQALVSAGRTILLTAYTNSAVDNICLKLAAAGVGFVRLVGSNTQVGRVVASSHS